MIQVFIIFFFGSWSTSCHQTNDLSGNRCSYAYIPLEYNIQVIFLKSTWEERCWQSSWSVAQLAGRRNGVSKYVEISVFLGRSVTNSKTVWSRRITLPSPSLYLLSLSLSLYLALSLYLYLCMSCLYASLFLYVYLHLSSSATAASFTI